MRKKTLKEIRQAIAIANRVWLSRQDINDAMIPPGLPVGQALLEQVRLAHDDMILGQAFMVEDVLRWVMGEEDLDDNFVTHMLTQFELTKAPERTGEKYESL